MGKSKEKTKGRILVHPSEIDDAVKCYIAQEIGIPEDHPVLEESWWKYIWSTIDTAIENISECLTNPRNAGKWDK